MRKMSSLDVRRSEQRQSQNENANTPYNTEARATLSDGLAMVFFYTCIQFFYDSN